MKKNKSIYEELPFLPNRENIMSRRYLKLMQRWVPFGMKYFREWPDKPDCGHFFGGVYWYGLETAMPLHVLACVASSSEYDPKITGFPREYLIQAAVKALRYLCFTHDTGPADCIRPESGMGYERLHKTKWGEKGKGFFPEGQCGKTLAGITVSALLLQEYLDKETISMIKEICKDYLNRFGAIPPAPNESVIWANLFLKRLGAIPPCSGVYYDTQTEENSWAALGMTSALLFLDMHKQVKNWDEVSKRWMLCASTVPDDMFNHLRFDRDEQVCGLCGQIITTLPDFMAENHGIVHTVYTSLAIILSGMTSAIYQLFGLEPPPHLRWHRKEIYSSLKYLTGAYGFVQPPQGMDWPYLFFGSSSSLHGYAGIYLGDDDAMFLERSVLSVEEKILNNNQGTLHSPDATKYCHDIQDPMIMRELRIGQFYPWIYLAHRLNMKKEYPEAEALAVLPYSAPGVKNFPHSGFIIHRHEKGQTSFSWRNQIMALPWTKNGMLTVAPSMETLLARVKVREYAESRKLIQLQVNEHDDGFAAVMEHNWHQDSIRQAVFLVSLPNGKMVSLEKLTALKDCTVEELSQGYLQIMNEKVNGLPACKGFRTLYHTQGKEVFKSFIRGDAGEDVFRELENPPWLNLDDEIGIVFSGAADVVYHNKHYFSPYRAVADNLFLNRNKAALGKYAAGADITSLAFLFCPEQPHAATAADTFIRAAAVDPETVCFLTDEYLTAGNFGARGGSFAFEFPRKSLIPIVTSAVTHVYKNKVIYKVELNGRQGDYFPIVTFIETNGENIKAVGAASGGLYLTNDGDTPVEVKLKGQKNVKINAYQIINISGDKKNGCN
ncbi:MAG: hypothetical protein PHV82_13215 [Victivallaceae bacterium]|nr:hypothetical protein [Victivallaceae bacterium]